MKRLIAQGVLIAGAAGYICLLTVPAAVAQSQTRSTSQAAGAQAYPHKPLRVIVSVPAGGSPDLVARAAAPGLSSVLGQQWVIDNRGGAGGLIGGELAAKAPPDGYTLFITNPSPLVILPYLQKRMPYNAMTDFTPVGLIAINHTLLVTHPSRPYRTITELITAARAQPGKLDYASAGSGSVTHLAMALLTSMAGVTMTHVPYKGAPHALTDVLGGHVAMTFSTLSQVSQHAKAERLRLLAIASAKRSPLAPQVPTISESGVPGYEITTWVGLLAPAHTPPQVIALLNDALAKALRMPDVKTQLEAQGVDAAGGTPEAFTAFIRSESDKYAKAVRLAGLKAD